MAKTRPTRRITQYNIKEEFRSSGLLRELRDKPN